MSPSLEMLVCGKMYCQLAAKDGYCEFASGEIARQSVSQRPAICATSSRVKVILVVAVATDQLTKHTTRKARKARPTSIAISPRRSYYILRVSRAGKPRFFARSKN